MVLPKPHHKYTGIPKYLPKHTQKGFNHPNAKGSNVATFIADYVTLYCVDANRKPKGNALVSYEDYEKVCHYRWFISKGYAKNNDAGFMHHLILPKKEGFVVDHINHNRSDNRRSNLRYVNRTDHARYVLPSKSNKSGVVGVKAPTKDFKKYVAYISPGGKQVYLGSFETLEEARTARLLGEERIYGKVYT
jgi:hypothetical protein